MNFRSKVDDLDHRTTVSCLIRHKLVSSLGLEGLPESELPDTTVNKIKKIRKILFIELN